MESTLCVAGRSLAGGVTTRARCDTRGRSLPAMRTGVPAPRAVTLARLPATRRWSTPAAAAPSSRDAWAATWSRAGASRAVPHGAVFGGRLGFRIGRTGARANRGLNAKADSAKDDLVDDDLMRRALDMAEDLDDDDDEFDMLDTVEGAIALDEEDGDEDTAVANAVAERMGLSEDDDEASLDLSEDDDESIQDDDETDETDDGEMEEGVALLRELFEYGAVDVTEWIELGEDEDVEVSGIADDSRVVLGGDVFVCVAGDTMDGHDFALDAVAAGAVAVVCERPIEGLGVDTPQVVVPSARAALPRLAAAFYGNPSASLTTVGVTGTSGKTTVTHLVRSILDANDTKCGVIGTTGYSLDDVRLTPHGGVWEAEEKDPTEGRVSTAPGWLAPYRGKYEVPNASPDALQCQQLMAGMLDNGARAAAMEVSSTDLIRGRVDCCDFDVAVFTNLTRDHLDVHGDMASYRNAKAELFRRLTDPERQRAVINLDVSAGSEGEEPFDEAAYFAEAAAAVPIVTYATQENKADEADVYVESAELSLFETAVTVRTPLGTFDAITGLVGEVNVSNVAAAVAAGIALEIPLDVIAEGVEAMEPAPGRMELVDEGQPFSVVVDNAHTPASLKRAIESVRGTGANNVITVFGCGGDRDASKRAEMGAVADTYSDIVFVTNDNPRTEDPYKILDDIVAGFRDRIYELEAIKEEALFPFLKDMYLIHPNARHETMKLQNMCRRYVIVDRFYAIRAAIAMAGEDDAVLICGKGHEDYIVVGTKKHWFDDRVEARDALHKIPGVQEAGIDTSNLPWGRRDRAGSGAGNVLDA